MMNNEEAPLDPLSTDGNGKHPSIEDTQPGKYRRSPSASKDEPAAKVDSPENPLKDNDINPAPSVSINAQPSDWYAVLHDGPTSGKGPFFDATIDEDVLIDPPHVISYTEQPFEQLNPSAESPTLLPISPHETTNPFLPHHVEEVDLYATQVTPAAYQPYPRRNQRSGRGAGPLSPVNSNTNRNAAPVRSSKPVPSGVPVRSKPRKNDPSRIFGCLTQVIIGMAFLVIIILIGMLSFAVFKYFSIRTALPDVHNLSQRASQFETTRILDRNGNSIYEILDPNAGRRTYVPLKKISPYVIATVLATEDKDFYNHPGFDPIAILRALWQNYTTGEVVSGASTITQQLARTLLLSPSERNTRSVERKAREIVLASEITRLYSKDEILELYLNEIYFGNLSYGIQAASETYFNTSAEKLNLAQASFLAGLPQAPSIYDIYTNRDEALNRNKQVLALTYALSQERGCIDVKNSAKPVCVDGLAANQAAKEIENFPFKKSAQSMLFPHWVNYVRSVLEDRYDAQTIYRSGFTVYTTLDPEMQTEAERIVREQVSVLGDRNVKDGALVAIRPGTGEILAMVGSADFYNEAISGQVNMAVSPRQPGSSIKPLTYLGAFEKGWTPSTLIWDVRGEFPPSGKPDDPSDPYVPVNYDGRYHGPVTVRAALANSFNIPAVKTLNFLGIYEPDGFINLAKRVGITTLNRPDYGLSLTLGGGEVTPLELTSFFSTLANGGRRIPPVAITKIVDYQGKVVYEYKPSAGEKVVRPEHAYLLTSILSDNEARTPMFGANSVLNLPFTAAVKTGTTNDFRDNWTLGYTPDLAVGVWVGNADYTPMQNTTGLTGAAPIWAQFMQYGIQKLTGGNPTPFARPAGIVEKVICSVSGTEPSEYCPAQRTEIFAEDQSPLPKEKDLWQKVKIDSWTGLKASAFCSDFTASKLTMNVSDSWARKWIEETDEGRQWAEGLGFTQPFSYPPKRECNQDDPHPAILFAGISEGQTINGSPLDIYAAVSATKNFKNFRLDWGKGEKPAEWKTLVSGNETQYLTPDRIFTWDFSKKPPSGVITLRIVMNSTKGTSAERRIHLNFQVPTVTPTEMPTPTETLVPPTDTPMPTETIIPVVTLIPGPSETPTP